MNVPKDINLGIVPVLVTDEKTAEAAAEWVEQAVLKLLAAINTEGDR